MITDEEALEYIPVVAEFKQAVINRDPLVVEACFRHTDPRVLAVWCAELWDEAQREQEESFATQGQNLRDVQVERDKLLALYADAKRRIADLRDILNKRVASSTASYKNRSAA